MEGINRTNLKSVQSVEGIKSFDKALETFDLDFKVDRVPLYINKGGLKKITIREAIIRSDNNKELGIVSDSYPIISPREKFEPLAKFAEEGIISFVDGGIFGKYGGKIYISARINSTINVNPSKGDIVEKRVIFYSSYDGSKSNEFGIAPFRLACSNGLLIPEYEMSARFKNTKNSGTQYEQISLKLEESLNQYRKLDEWFKILNEHKVTEKETDNFIKNILQIVDFDNESTRKKNMYAELNETLFNGVGQEVANEKTAWWLLNGATCWTNNILAAKKDSPFDFVYFDTGRTYNERAYNFVKELVPVA